MKNRSLGKTGLMVSIVGQGGGSLGGKSCSRGAEGSGCVPLAVDHGISSIDSAPCCGANHFNLQHSLTYPDRFVTVCWKTEVPENNA